MGVTVLLHLNELEKHPKVATVSPVPVRSPMAAFSDCPRRHLAGLKPLLVPAHGKLPSLIRVCQCVQVEKSPRSESDSEPFKFFESLHPSPSTVLRLGVLPAAMEADSLRLFQVSPLTAALPHWQGPGVTVTVTVRNHLRPLPVPRPCSSESPHAPQA